MLLVAAIDTSKIDSTITSVCENFLMTQSYKKTLTPMVVGVHAVLIELNFNSNTDGSGRTYGLCPVALNAT